MRLLVVSLILVFLLGCENPFLSNPSGTFIATVTGGISASLEGRAEIENPNLLVSDAYKIALTPPDGRAIYFYSRSRPRAGTYSILPFETQAPQRDFTGMFVSEVTGGFFFSRGGEMEIVATSGGGLQGRFEFEAEGRPNRPRVTISGTFNVK